MISSDELEIFLAESAKIYQEDTNWLRSRGWQETAEVHKESGFEAKIWVSPSGRRCVHCSSMIGFKEYSQAIDVAQMEYLKELGWGTIEVHHFEPQYLGLKKEELDNPPYAEEDVWSHFSHPISGKVYMFLEAITIARYCDNKEKLSDSLCKKTEEIQRQLGDKKLRDGDKLFIKFVLNKETDTHEWVLMNIESKNT